MPAYVILNNHVHDAAKMREYVPLAIASMQPYDAELLVVDESFTVLEGEPPHPRLIVIKFPSREHALTWYRSPEYQAVLELRRAATAGFCLLADGFAMPADSGQAPQGSQKNRRWRYGTRGFATHALRRVPGRGDAKPSADAASRFAAPSSIAPWCSSTNLGVHELTRAAVCCLLETSPASTDLGAHISPAHCIGGRSQ